MSSDISGRTGPFFGSLAPLGTCCRFIENLSGGGGPKLSGFFAEGGRDGDLAGVDGRSRIGPPWAKFWAANSLSRALSMASERASERGGARLRLRLRLRLALRFRLWRRLCLRRLRMARSRVSLPLSAWEPTSATLFVARQFEQYS